MNTEADSLLLYLAEAITTIHEKQALFDVVKTQMRLVFPFDIIIISVFDAAGKNKRLFLRDYFDAEEYSGRLAPPVYFTAIAGSPLEDLLTAPWVTHTPLAESLARYPDFESFTQLWAVGIRYLTAVPLQLGGRLTGALTLASRQQPLLTPADEALLAKMGSLVAVAVANTLAFEDLARREQERSLQLSVSNALLSFKQRAPLFRAVAESLDRVVPFHYFGIRVGRVGSAAGLEGLAEFQHVAGPDAPLTTLDPGRPQATLNRLYGQAAELWPTATLYTGDDFKAQAVRSPLLRHKYDEYGTRSVLLVPLWQRVEGTALLSLASPDPHGFGPADLATMQALAPQIALALENLFAFEQIEALKAQVEQERTYLIEELHTTVASPELVGPSAALHTVQLRLTQVAPTDTTVLITGETGTGKELVARALHRLSPRRERALIKLNCAALPAQLIESELFGHEKGAFTGAVERRIGKFELADGGTIFLDEIGELPLDLQAKLLRVLQEKEFERLGGSRVLTTNARVVAATNRMLEAEVAAGRFRADLYYRLNVFPLHLPPLRERPEDIEPLLHHAVRRLSQRLTKPARPIRPADLAALQAYAWPGNVRELEHLVERALILNQGPYLEFAGLPPAGGATEPAASPAALATLRAHERAHILTALACTGGRVSGPQGAAQLLDINSKTLETRMKKLGISRTVSMK